MQKWALDKDAVEVRLNDPSDFLKVKETLTRMGVPGFKDKTLYQSCYILHKKGRYFILHFKELFILDGKESNFDDNDRKRRNLIARLLDHWGLVEVIHKDRIEDTIEMNKLMIVSFEEKNEWNLQSKYNIGGSKKTNH